MWIVFLWFFERQGALKRKNHAQDCGTLMRDQRPAILPWFSGQKWRPSFRWYGPLTRYRPAAGLLLDTPRRHSGPARKIARDACENSISDECYAFRAEPCSAPRPCA